MVPSVLIVTISVSVQGQPPDAPTDVVWKSDYKLIGDPTLLEAVSAIAAIVFAYAAPVPFSPSSPRSRIHGSTHVP
jgi:hypothetical protein